MFGNRTWPRRIWIVRHGQSVGNLAWDQAEADGKLVTGISGRNADAGLSDRGKTQAAAVGLWFKQKPTNERPTVVVSSPYTRAVQTADRIITAGRLGRNLRNRSQDERLREKEFGILDGLTTAGILQKHPEEAARIRQLGNFYYRPPGGESWCDVILRVRSLLHTVACEHPKERVLLVCHSVVVLALRYLLEGMTEQQILDLDRAGGLANGSVTAYRARSSRCTGQLVLEHEYFVPPPVASRKQPGEGTRVLRPA